VDSSTPLGKRRRPGGGSPPIVGENDLAAPRPGATDATATGLPPLAGIRCTDADNRERFAAAHGGDVRYVPELRQWLAWDGSRWSAGGDVTQRAIDTARGILHEAAEERDSRRRDELIRWSRESQSKARLDAMLSLAAKHPALRASIKQFDVAPNLFNCLNGTIDLRTGELRGHRREDFFTKLSPIAYEPAARAPRWSRFLSEVFDGNGELTDYVRRALGYGLTAETSEQCFFILHGAGSNGKSLLISTLKRILGDHAETTSADALMAKPTGGATPELARLRGARMVSATESEASARLAEGLVKALTGEDEIFCRFLHSNGFTYRPVFKLYLATNHKPEIRGTDDGIWRRVRLVPFNVRFEGAMKDPQLEAKLNAELPGILADCVRGAVEWYRDGLGDCAAVSGATQNYRAESDTLSAGFIADCCELGDAASFVKVADLTGAYLRWCEMNGEIPLDRKQLKAALEGRGLRQKPRKVAGVTARVWEGIALHFDAESSLTAFVGSSGDVGGEESATLNVN
jgi:putative DNA primase/helicase